MADEIADQLVFWQRRARSTRRALTQAMHENRVRADCLEIAVEALDWYGHNCSVLLCGKAGEALIEIGARLAKLETNGDEDRKGT